MPVVQRADPGRSLSAVPRRFGRLLSSAVRGVQRRVADAGWSVVQTPVAAGLAWYIAHTLLGHHQPFFAPTAAAVSLSKARVLMAEVDLCPVVVAFLDQVDEPEGVVRGGDRAAVLGLNRDVVAEPITAESFAGHTRAEPERRAHEDPVECRGRGREILNDERRPGADLVVELRGDAAEIGDEAIRPGRGAQRGVAADDEQGYACGIGQTRDRAVDVAEGAGQRAARGKCANYDVRALNGCRERCFVGGVALDIGHVRDWRAGEGSAQCGDLVAASSGLRDDGRTGIAGAADDGNARHEVASLRDGWRRTTRYDYRMSAAL